MFEGENRAIKRLKAKAQALVKQYAVLKIGAPDLRACSFCKHLYACLLQLLDHVDGNYTAVLFTQR